MKSEFKMLIDGVLAEGNAVLEVINPATGEAFATVARASQAQAAQAIAAAKKAQPGWAALPQAERRRCIESWADAIEVHADELAHLVTREQGKSLADARQELGGCTYFLRAFAAGELPVEILKEGQGERIELHHRPLGVVVGIGPWNFPAMVAIGKTAPALVLGNSVVFKPAPTTPATALRIGELAADIFPPGVLNMLSDANDLGDFLTSHPDVAKVTFTGSTATGKRIALSGASTLKRLTLELGGNDAAIVLDDVDVKRTAPALIGAAFMNAGQVCVAIKRLYVPDGIYDEMCGELASLADAIAVGNGLEQGVTMGPLQNAAQFEKAKKYLEFARRDGTIVAGGSAADGAGYFVRPTIVRDIDEESPLVTEEQFAPILPVIRYHDVDKVIERANDTKLGLGGSVWSASPDKAYACAKRIDSGTVWINRHGGGSPDIPFGGAKESGVGVEFSQLGLAEFTQRMVISIPEG